MSNVNIKEWCVSKNGVKGGLSEGRQPAAIELRLADESERFGWHRLRHSLSTWANEPTKDITVSQRMLRHAKPDTTATYTHGNFGKALDAQRVYMEQLLRMKPASESTQ